MTYLKILLIRIAKFFWLQIGNFFRLFQDKKVDPFSFETIIINRSDRLGDAIISRPLIACFVEYMQSKGWKWHCEVLASGANISILEPLETLENVRVKKVNSASYYEYSRNPLKTLFGTVQFLQEFRRKKRERKSKTLFIDLLDSVTELGEYRDIDGIKNAFWVSANRGLLNPCFDISYAYRFTRDGRQLNANYIDFFQKIFDWKDFDEFVFSRNQYFYPEKKNDSKEILLFLSVKSMRDIGAHLWEKIVRNLVKYQDITVTIMDIEASETFVELEKRLKGDEKIHFLLKKMSFDDFMSFTKGFGGVIGIDGGGINLIRNLTNSLTIFTVGDASVWSPYHLDRKVETKPCGKNWDFHTFKNENNQHFAYINRKSFWVPSFQLELPKSTWQDLDTEKLAHFIQLHFFKK